MGGAIGGTTTLKDLTINSTTTGAGDITLANIGSSTVGVAGNTLIGNTSTGTINLNGTIYKTTGSQTYQASATGDDTGDNINIANAATFTTTDTNVLFETSDVELADDAHLTITTGVGTAGDITFQGAIHGTANNNTTNIAGLTSGTGTVTVKAIDTNIEDITITGPTKLQGNITCLLYTSPSPRDS